MLIPTTRTPSERLSLSQKYWLLSQSLCFTDGAVGVDGQHVQQCVDSMNFCLAGQGDVTVYWVILDYLFIMSK